MVELFKSFVSPFVITYIIGIIAIPLLVPLITKFRATLKNKRRKAEGLDRRIIKNAGDDLAQHRIDSIIETIFVILLGTALPLFLLWLINTNSKVITVSGEQKIEFIKGGWFEKLDPQQEREKINLAYAAFILWTLVSGTPVAKNFLTGLAFRSLSSFSKSIQLGDRVTISGHHGVVTKIGIFYTQLRTFSDDQISIPTGSLIGEVISSTNAGQSASLCILPFYISPQNTSDKIRKAEDIIWETIQSSIYFDFSHPLKIHFTQRPHALVLTAKCYVTSTYEEPEFCSRASKSIILSFNQAEIILADTVDFEPIG